MRIAVIDLGTNSIRFAVHEVRTDSNPNTLYREKLMVKLGERVFETGRLQPLAIRRTLQALMRFQKIAKRFHVKEIIAFGTSALREARNSAEFVAQVLKKTGIRLKVISGDEEARLIALGIVSGEVLPEQTFILVDIGGGSTEFSLCKNKKVTRSLSVPLGTARLQQLFLTDLPPSSENIKLLRKQIRKTLRMSLNPSLWPQVEKLMGSSGTIKCLSKMLGKDVKIAPFDLAGLSYLISEMSTMTKRELSELPGMEVSRMEMLLPGAILFEECMKFFGAKKSSVTELSLRDGILKDYIDQNSSKGRVQTLSKTEYLNSMIDKINRYVGDEKQIRKTAELSQALFTQLRSIHQLDPRWSKCLMVAAMSRNIGEWIHPLRHEFHSSYLVKTSQWPGLNKRETQLVSLLCLYHEKGKATSKELANLSLAGCDAATFWKLLAILRVLDAIDSDSKGPGSFKRIQKSKTCIKLLMSKKSMTGLEAIRLNLRDGLFQKIFHRSILAIPT